MNTITDHGVSTGNDLDIGSENDGLWDRDFQHTPAMEETHKSGILIDDYLEILNKTGWYHIHIIQAPLSSQRFSAEVVSAMQKRHILRVTSRYVIILSQKN